MLRATTPQGLALLSQEVVANRVPNRDRSVLQSRPGSATLFAMQPLPQQQSAIQASLGPVLVIAGPGAGKTFCLVARIEHLIAEKGLDPQRICAVTFTNRAAEEIATVRRSRQLARPAEEFRVAGRERHQQQRVHPLRQVVEVLAVALPLALRVVGL